MRNRNWVRLLAVLGSFVLAGAVQAQAGTVTGKVTDGSSGSPISGATVVVLSGNTVVGAQATSGDDGSYRIGGVPAGTYSLRAQFPGYTPYITGITVTAGGTLTVNPTLGATQLQAFVVTAGRKPEKALDAPASLSMVSSERVAERPAATVTDHLKATPGLSISQGGIAQANIVSRGFNNAFSTSMMMMQDYRFAAVPSLRVNVPFLFTGTSEDISRIEVLQGPASALYGPNSANGVLHVITKSPFESQGTTVSLDGGSQSLMRFAARHAGTVGQTFGYKLSGEYFQAHDWEYSDPAESGCGGTGVYCAGATADALNIPASRQGQAVQRDWDLSRMAFEGRADYRPNANTEAVTTFGLSKIGNGIEPTTTFGSAQAKNWTYTSIQQRLRYKRTFAQVFYNKSNSGNDNPTDDNGTFYLRSGIPVVDKSSVLSFQVQQGLTFGRTDLTAGFDYIATSPETEGTINGRNEDDDNITETGAYLQVTQPLTERVDFIGAIRSDMNNRIEGTQFSPRAAIRFKMTDAQTFRFTFNRAFNSPASFSMFLDQWSGQTPAPGMPVQIFGNPPKEGWHFDRTGTPAINGGLRMRSPYGAGVADADASRVWGGFWTAFPTIVNGLPNLTPTQKAQLTGLMAHPVIGPAVRGATPTFAQTPSYLLNMNTQTQTTAAAVRDLAPLGANYANTWEFGWKGDFGKAWASADYWYQIRPADPTVQVVNPGVMYAPTQLGNYLVTTIYTALRTAGADSATAMTTALQAGPALTQVAAALPQGAVAATNPLYDQPFLIYTYQNGTGQIDVRGIDLAAGYQLSNFWSVDASYSNISRNLWENAPGASAASPVAANTPKHRATLTVRRDDGIRSVELRGRYADAMRVNSGVLNNFGQSGLYGTRVPVNMLVDANFSWMNPFQLQGFRWSLGVQNLLNNEVNTFPGVPKQGLLASTRIAYSF